MKDTTMELAQRQADWFAMRGYLRAAAEYERYAELYLRPRHTGLSDQAVALIADILRW